MKKKQSIDCGSCPIYEQVLKKRRSFWHKLFSNSSSEETACFELYRQTTEIHSQLSSMRVQATNIYETLGKGGTKKERTFWREDYVDKILDESRIEYIKEVVTRTEERRVKASNIWERLSEDYHYQIGKFEPITVEVKDSFTTYPRLRDLSPEQKKALEEVIAAKKNPM